ncbi:MAG: hypothetical protein AAF502_10085 [Bacteroidota bacterium]
MENKIISRIIRETGNTSLFKTLTEDLSSSDFQSLLLEVYKKRTDALSASQVFKQYCSSRFVPPVQYPAEAMLQLEQYVYSIRPEGFEAIELSPVGPLGNCSVVATVSQNKVLSASRNLELVADATNMMALEAAKRRKGQGSKATVKLCTSHRHIRTQQLASPEHSAHFKIFCAVTAGRDEGAFSFELRELQEHLSYHIGILSHPAFGFNPQQIEIRLTRLNQHLSQALIIEQLINPLQDIHEGVLFKFDPERETGRGYYQCLCFKINVSIPGKGEFEFGDGGFTNWTQQYLGNKKERFLISALGTEIILNITGAFR